jgi:hypothetical protein
MHRPKETCSKHGKWRLLIAIPCISGCVYLSCEGGGVASGCASSAASAKPLHMRSRAIAGDGMEAGGNSYLPRLVAAKCDGACEGFGASARPPALSEGLPRLPPLPSHLHLFFTLLLHCKPPNMPATRSNFDGSQLLTGADCDIARQTLRRSSKLLRKSQERLRRLQACRRGCPSRRGGFRSTLEVCTVLTRQQFSFDIAVPW